MFLKFLLIVGVVWCASGQDSKYTIKYDDVNVKEILANRRLLTSYVDCVLDAGPCTAEGMLLKEVIPEALQNECLKCSGKQKKMASIAIKHLVEKEKDIFGKLENRFDSGGKFRKHYRGLAEKEGIYF